MPLCVPFQILQKDPLKLAAIVGIRRGGVDLLEGQVQVAPEHLCSKRVWPSEEALVQTFDLR